MINLTENVFDIFKSIKICTSSFQVQILKVLRKHINLLLKQIFKLSLKYKKVFQDLSIIEFCVKLISVVYLIEDE